MPGRLMVGRMALDHVVKVRVLPGQPICYIIQVTTMDNPYVQSQSECSVFAPLERYV